MRGRIKFLFITVALGTAIFLNVGLVHAVTIKYSTTVPHSHIFTKQAFKVKSDLEKASKGKFLVEVHPFNKLGNVPTVISLLQAGALEIGVMPIGDLALRNTAFYSWFVPMTFKDISDAHRATKTPTAKKIVKMLENQGMVFLAYAFPGQRHVISTFPVSSMDDFKGKKVRTFPNDAFKKWWMALGAAPSAVRLPEIAQSLQTGVLDAVDVDLDLLVGLKLNKQAPHLVLTNHMAFPGVVLASKKWWDKLPKEDQAIIGKVFQSAEEYALTEQVKVEVENLETLKADGIKIHEVDMSVLEKPATEVKEYLIKRDPIVKEFIDGIYKTQ